MTTASMAASLNGAAGTQQKMAQVLTDRAAERRVFDRLYATPKAGWDWVRHQADRLHVTDFTVRATGFGARLLNAARRVLAAGWQRVASALGLVGPGNIAVLTFTTSHGRNAFEDVLRFGWKIVTVPLRLAGKPFAFVLRHTGRPGAKVSLVLQVAWAVTRDKTITAYGQAMTWLSDHDTHPVVDIIRTSAVWRVVMRIANRFIADRKIRIGVYALVALTLPETGDTRTIDRAVAGLKWGGSQAQRAATALNRRADAGVPEEASEAPGASERLDGPVPLTALGKADVDGFVTAVTPETVMVTAPGGPVTISVHPQPDGTTVYRCGESVFAGTVPAGTSHYEVAAQIVAAAAATVHSGPPQMNRGSRRAARRWAPKPAAAGE